MKKTLLAGVAAGVALVAGAPAHAADLGRRPAYAPPPVVAPIPLFSWTGCYIGGHIGGGWGRKEITIPNLAAAAEIPPSEVTFSVPPVTDHTSGFLGGGQVGCNYQFAPNWVIGIEGDGSAADIKGDVNAPPVTFIIPGVGTSPPITSTFHAKTEWLASVTGRLGWAAGPWLIYAKGGVAWAGDKFAADIPIFEEHLEASQTRTGSVTLTGFFPGVGPSTFPAGPVAVPGVDIKQTISAVKFGINYRFGWGKGKAPVVASY